MLDCSVTSAVRTKKRGLHGEMLEKAINHQFESSGMVQLKHPKIIRLGIGPQLGLFLGDDNLFRTWTNFVKVAEEEPLSMQ